MNFVDIIIAAIILVLFASAARYIYKSKKSGAKCIGCPNCNSCGSDDHDCCSK